jgi:hypothetical protein
MRPDACGSSYLGDFVRSPVETAGAILEFADPLFNLGRRATDNDAHGKL